MERSKDVYSGKEVDELIKQELKERELLIANQRDKISGLKAETIRLLKERDEIDKREVEVAKTLEKYEKKNKYLENIIKVRLAIEIEKLNDFKQNLKDNGADTKDIERLDDIIYSISAFSSDVTEIESTQSAGKNDDKIDCDNLEDRYLKLLSVYEYNKAFLGSKNRGRPKKDEDTVEGYLKEKKRQKEKEKEEMLFDIDEALNPTESLEDIMKDLINTDK